MHCAHYPSLEYRVHMAFMHRQPLLDIFWDPFAYVGLPNHTKWLVSFYILHLQHF